MLKFSLVSLFLSCCLAVGAEPELATSIEADADYLLETTDFMDATFGMAIKDVEVTPERVVVQTTGAEFIFEPETGLLTLRQCLVKNRVNAIVHFPKWALRGLKVEREGTGAVLLTAARDNIKLRINGDSLLMLKTTRNLKVSYDISFIPASLREADQNFLWLDEFGGIGSYIAAGPKTSEATRDNLNTTHKLKAQQVLWLSVFPPKPFNWEASLKDNVVWHWSMETGYPSDEQIKDWSQYGNILLQQAEVMLWKDWSLRFIPRFGEEEFERVNQTCKENGMRNIVYTSPFYFVAGTEFEDKAMNSFDNFAVTGFTPGDGRGINWPIFVDQIAHVMRDYKPQGLYFDGIYTNVVRTYIVTRKAREIVTDKGILEYHATWSPPSGDLYVPQIDSYYDYILRGEGVQSMYENDEYLRYFVSTYNISNSIGVLCNNNDYKLDDIYIKRLLDNNIRLHMIPSWANDYRGDVMKQSYWPALTPALKDHVEAQVDKRDTQTKIQWEKFQQAIKQDISSSQIAFAENFTNPQLQAAVTQMPATGMIPLVDGWQGYFSPKSNGNMTVQDGILKITAKANTCAYLTRDLPPNTLMVQCRVRCGDAFAGMSWGPGILVVSDKGMARMNLRSEGRIGIDRPRGQSLIENYPSGNWTWLRIRLAGNFVLYEVSEDGETWTHLMSETTMVTTPKKLILGKIANEGTNVEYQADDGYIGTSYIDDVRIFTEKQ